MVTKSKGLGRGGVRPGSGRRPKVSTIDWDAVAKRYYLGSEPLEDVCSSFGIGYGDLLAHAAQHHWLQRRPTKAHPDDLGDLASALAHEMFSVDVMERPRRFVGAMAALGAREVDIAEALRIDLRNLKSEFAKELARANLAM